MMEKRKTCDILNMKMDQPLSHDKNGANQQYQNGKDQNSKNSKTSILSQYSKNSKNSRGSKLSGLPLTEMPESIDLLKLMQLYDFDLQPKRFPNTHGSDKDLEPLENFKYECQDILEILSKISHSLKGYSKSSNQTMIVNIFNEDLKNLEIMSSSAMEKIREVEQLGSGIHRLLDRQKDSYQISFDEFKMMMLNELSKIKISGENKENISQVNEGGMQDAQKTLLMALKKISGLESENLILKRRQEMYNQQTASLEQDIRELQKIILDKFDMNESGKQGLTLLSNIMSAVGNTQAPHRLFQHTVNNQFLSNFNEDPKQCDGHRKNISKSQQSVHNSFSNIGGNGDSVILQESMQKHFFSQQPGYFKKRNSTKPHYQFQNDASVAQDRHQSMLASHAAQNVSGATGGCDDEGMAHPKEIHSQVFLNDISGDSQLAKLASNLANKTVPRTHLAHHEPHFGDDSGDIGAPISLGARLDKPTAQQKVERRERQDKRERQLENSNYKKKISEMLANMQMKLQILKQDSTHSIQDQHHISSSLNTENQILNNLDQDHPHGEDGESNELLKQSLSVLDEEGQPNMFNKVQMLNYQSNKPTKKDVDAPDNFFSINTSFFGSCKGEEAVAEFNDELPSNLKPVSVKKSEEQSEEPDDSRLGNILGSEFNNLPVSERERKVMAILNNGSDEPRELHEQMSKNSKSSSCFTMLKNMDGMSDNGPSAQKTLTLTLEHVSQDQIMQNGMMNMEMDDIEGIENMSNLSGLEDLHDNLEASGPEEKIEGQQIILQCMEENLYDIASYTGTFSNSNSQIIKHARSLSGTMKSGNTQNRSVIYEQTARHSYIVKNNQGVQIRIPQLNLDAITQSQGGQYRYRMNSQGDVVVNEGYESSLPSGDQDAMIQYDDETNDDEESNEVIFGQDFLQELSSVGAGKKKKDSFQNHPIQLNNGIIKNFKESQNFEMGDISELEIQDQKIKTDEDFQFDLAASGALKDMIGDMRSSHEGSDVNPCDQAIESQPGEYQSENDHPCDHQIEGEMLGDFFGENSDRHSQEQVDQQPKQTDNWNILDELENSCEQSKGESKQSKQKSHASYNNSFEDKENCVMQIDDPNNPIDDSIPLNDEMIDDFLHLKQQTRPQPSQGINFHDISGISGVEEHVIENNSDLIQDNPNNRSKLSHGKSPILDMTQLSHFSHFTHNSRKSKDSKKSKSKGARLLSPGSSNLEKSQEINIVNIKNSFTGADEMHGCGPAFKGGPEVCSDSEGDMDVNEEQLAAEQVWDGIELMKYPKQPMSTKSQPKSKGFKGNQAEMRNNQINPNSKTVTSSPKFKFNQSRGRKSSGKRTKQFQKSQKVGSVIKSCLDSNLPGQPNKQAYYSTQGNLHSIKEAKSKKASPLVKGFSPPVKKSSSKKASRKNSQKAIKEDMSPVLTKFSPQVTKGRKLVKSGKKIKSKGSQPENQVEQLKSPYQNNQVDNPHRESYDTEGERLPLHQAQRGKRLVTKSLGTGQVRNLQNSAMRQISGSAQSDAKMQNKPDTRSSSQNPSHNVDHNHKRILKKNIISPAQIMNLRKKDDPATSNTKTKLTLQRPKGDKRQLLVKNNFLRIGKRSKAAEQISTSMIYDQSGPNNQSQMADYNSNQKMNQSVYQNNNNISTVTGLNLSKDTDQPSILDLGEEDQILDHSNYHTNDSKSQAPVKKFKGIKLSQGKVITKMKKNKGRKLSLTKKSQNILPQNDDHADGFERYEPKVVGAQYQAPVPPCAGGKKSINFVQKGKLKVIKDQSQQSCNVNPRKLYSQFKSGDSLYSQNSNSSQKGHNASGNSSRKTKKTLKLPKTKGKQVKQGKSILSSISSKNPSHRQNVKNVKNCNKMVKQQIEEEDSSSISPVLAKKSESKIGKMMKNRQPESQSVVLKQRVKKPGLKFKFNQKASGVETSMSQYKKNDLSFCKGQKRSIGADVNQSVTHQNENSLLMVDDPNHSKISLKSNQIKFKEQPARQSMQGRGKGIPQMKLDQIVKKYC